MSEREFHITVLGRTLQHLGVQTYKRRDIAIAELVANCWDAGAKNVWIEAPELSEYSQDNSLVSIQDDGCGMSDTDVQTDYLVIGRNRRDEGGVEAAGRRVMGRKGIGKLAGFGIGEQMELVTWKDRRVTRLDLHAANLVNKTNDVSKIPIVGQVADEETESDQGTCLVISQLKHKMPLDLSQLRESLARRFSNKIRGQMYIWVNNEPVEEPDILYTDRVPDDGMSVDTLSTGDEVRFYYAFAKETIKSTGLRGFTVYVNGKTAQAPPFFFDVEGTASGQHSTRYVYGAIEADFLDAGTDDTSDLISTDRQEIDWADERAKAFFDWGQEFARRVLRECADRKGADLEKQVELDSELSGRIEALDQTSQKQVAKLIRTLGSSDAEPARLIELSSALVSAFEYKHFHDVIDDISAVGDDPNQLNKLLEQIDMWRVLESRAILEIIKGRLEIIDKFHALIVSNAPETASKTSKDNLHDVLAGYPWLLNPDWQVLVEERKVSKMLAELADKEISDPEERERLDFLALGDDQQMFVVEIKRPGHPVSLDELQRLERYKEQVESAYENVKMVLIYGEKHDLRPKTWDEWRQRGDLILLRWADVHGRTRRAYQHYRAVLERNVNSPDFSGKRREVTQTRKVIAMNTVHRNVDARKGGLGSQDVKFEMPKPRKRET